MNNTTPYMPNGTTNSETVIKEDQRIQETATGFFQIGQYLFSMGEEVSKDITREEEQKKYSRIEAQQEREKTSGK